MSSSPLPPLYDRWMNELTGREIEGEPEATCLDCAMLGAPDGMASFDSRTKCCTYTPTLANFLVGAALADERLDEVDGRASLRQRIARRVGVTPMGARRGALAAIVGERARDCFGRSPSLLCPHYHSPTGKCGVWLHRNAVCSTWFCKHDRGAVGQAFWHATRDLLEQVEFELASWCVLELGAPCRLEPTPSPDPGATQLNTHDLAETVSNNDYARIWGDWIGREEDLFTRADQLVRDLSWDEVVGICGPQVGLRARAMEDALDKRDRRVVPTALVLRKLQILRHGEPAVLGTYTGTDPIAVPGEIIDLLRVFRGQPTQSAREELAHESDIDLDDDLLVRLVDVGVLCSADEE